MDPKYINSLADRNRKVENANLALASTCIADIDHMFFDCQDVRKFWEYVDEVGIKLFESYAQSGHYRDSDRASDRGRSRPLSYWPV